MKCIFLKIEGWENVLNQGHHLVGLIQYMQLSRVVSVEHYFKTQSYARTKGVLCLAFPSTMESSELTIMRLSARF
jgi:hypothetical protein